MFRVSFFKREKDGDRTVLHERDVDASCAPEAVVEALRLTREKTIRLPQDHQFDVYDRAGVLVFCGNTGFREIRAA
jgi:hypothetical protein